ncbi:MAG: hypothetical protein HYU36_04230 [Planctomycetes bacterium]|nr:hypothetical protein [Planctomycetota bacterium]
MNKKKKIKLFRLVMSKLEKKYPEALPIKRTDPLDQLLTSIIHFDSLPEKARLALELLRKEFVDWNEVRVSAVSEMAAVLREAGLEEDRARLLKSALTHLFLKKNQLSLDFMKNYPEKQASEFLARFEGLHPSIVDEVLLLSLGFQRFPLNEKTQRVCERLGWVDDSDEAGAARTMSAVIPKTLKGKAYVLLKAHAEETCKTKAPACPSCVLQSDCLYYAMKQASPKGRPGDKPVSTVEIRGRSGRARRNGLRSSRS